MIHFRSFRPAEEWNTTLGGTSGYAVTTSTSSGTKYSDLMISRPLALPLVRLTTSDLGCLRKDRPRHLSLSGPIGRRVLDVQRVLCSLAIG